MSGKVWVLIKAAYDCLSTVMLSYLPSRKLFSPLILNQIELNAFFLIVRVNIDCRVDKS